MNEGTPNNRVELVGSLAGRPAYSHTNRGRDYFNLPLTVKRLSGTEDELNIVCDKRLLQETRADIMDAVRFSGEIRTYNNKTGIGSRLIVFVYAEEMELTNQPHRNDAFIRGTVCKRPNYRITPLGREICDLHVAVNRPTGQSDYIPCICWGKNASAAAMLEVGDMVAITGRLQSRGYIKVTEGREERRTAYELSVSTLDEL